MSSQPVSGQAPKAEIPTISPQLTPDQAKFLLTQALPRIKMEHATTMRVIEAIPLDKGDYRPDDISKSALELAWHIVAAEKRFLSGMCTGAFNFTPINRPDSIRNSAQIAAWFDETFNANIKQVEVLSGEQLAPDHRFSRHVPAACRYVSAPVPEPFHPPSRTAFHLPPAHGREGACDLWRKL